MTPGEAREPSRSAAAVSVLAVTEADTAILVGGRVAALLQDTHARLVVVDVAALPDPTIAAVDVLLHVRLAVRRLGGRVELGRPSDVLLDLIERMGMAELLPVMAP